jgi:hypothetical protein
MRDSRNTEAKVRICSGRVIEHLIDQIMWILSNKALGRGEFAPRFIDEKMPASGCVCDGNADFIPCRLP